MEKIERGKFVVLDGGDGCGKDEMAKRLRTHFANRSDIIFYSRTWWYKYG